MRLVSFLKGGSSSYGILENDGSVLDLGHRYGSRFPSLSSAIAGGLFEEVLARDLLRHPSGAIELLAPIPDAKKIICVGRNYRNHVAEMGTKLPEYPSLFSRFPDSLVSPSAALVKPSVSEQFDFEGELAIVIGKMARHVRAQEAMDYIFGYTCFNDGSIRDFQQQSLMTGKNFCATGSFGPAILLAREVTDLGAMTVETRLNGQVMQSAALSGLIFDVPFLVEYVSRFTPLSPGDIISTGTPEGVGVARNPKVWMKPGDTIEVTVSGVGTLVNKVAADPTDKQ